MKVKAKWLRNRQQLIVWDSADGRFRILPALRGNGVIAIDLEVEGAHQINGRFFRTIGEAMGYIDLNGHL